jgi:phage tail sheath protein FI
VPVPRTPGVYIDEGPGGPRRIAQVSLSTIGMVGVTERGPLDRPTPVTSLAEFTRLFGGALDHRDDPDRRGVLPHAVRGAFEAGARCIYIARVLGPAATLAEGLLPMLALRVHARSPGQWGNRLRVALHPGKAGEVDLTVVLADAAGQVVRSERFDGLGIDPDHPRHAIKVVGRLGDAFGQSDLVRLSTAATAPGVDMSVTSCELSGGKDDLAGIRAESHVGQLAGKGVVATGLAALSAVTDIGIIAVPGQTDASVQAAMIAQCEKLRHRFAVLDSVAEADPGEVILQRQRHDSARAALYYPWLEVAGPGAAMNRLRVPPSGHLCGVIAQMDVERGIHKAPANVALKSVIGLATEVGEAVQDQLNPLGINVIRDFRGAGRGIRVWGARTLSSDPEWRYIAVRRLVSLVESSVERGLGFVVFEPSSPALWGEIRQLVTDFLLTLWRTGAFAGIKASEAFFVAVGPETMTQADIAAGRLVVIIGLAVMRPAEFIICQIELTAAEGQQE